ncbi:MAG: PQQ-binding-like beta-propeller repeat protein, partial [Candidatus Tectomicrobia bacterium]
MSRVVVKASGLLVSVVLVVLMAGGAQAFPVRDSALAQPAGEEWLHVNGDWQGTRFSHLKQLNTFNVKGLKVAWVRALGGTTGLQATSIYHDGLLYIPLDNKVQAIDAKTGRRVWKFEHELPEDWGHWQFNDFLINKHRGVAIYNDKIYFLSNDNVLHALHYKTGEVAFSKKIREHPKTYESSEDAGGYLSTVAPLAIPGKILLPMNASDMGGKPGYVDAVHPDTGELLWSANMIPGPGEPGHDSWPGDSAKYGGAGPWITGSWDPALKMYFTGTANAYPYTPHSERQGRGGGDYENVGAASIVAVNTDS